MENETCAECGYPETPKDRITDGLHDLCREAIEYAMSGYTDKWEYEH